MKVNIGPYKDEGERKVEVHIHKYDTWNMDHTLALIVLPMLKQLKETKHGSPFVEDEDVPEKIRSTSAKPKENDWDTDEFWHQRWEWVMDEMIWAFQHEVDDDWEEQFFFDDEPQYAVRELRMKGIGPAQLLLFPDDDGETETYELYEFERDIDFGRFDKEGYEKYQKRIKKGFELFGKYYQGLWD